MAKKESFGVFVIIYSQINKTYKVMYKLIYVALTSIYNLLTCV